MSTPNPDIDHTAILAAAQGELTRGRPMTPRNLAPDLRAHGLTLCPACTDTVTGELTTVGCERCHHSGRAHLFWLTPTEHDILIDHGPGGTPSSAGRMTIADPDVRADLLRLLATVPGIVVRDRR